MKTLLQIEMYYVREYTSTCRFLNIINSTRNCRFLKNNQLDPYGSRWLFLRIYSWSVFSTTELRCEKEKSNNKKINFKICTKRNELKIRWGNGSSKGLYWEGVMVFPSSISHSLIKITTTKQLAYCWTWRYTITLTISSVTNILLNVALHHNPNHFFSFRVVLIL